MSVVSSVTTALPRASASVQTIPELRPIPALRHVATSVTAGVDPDRTVSLSKAKDPPEGLPISITATLSAPLARDVSIPVTVTGSPRVPEGWGSLMSIVINSGETTGTGTITTVADLNTVSESATVSLGALPSGLTAGADRSVTVAVEDKEFGSSSTGPPPIPGLNVAYMGITRNGKNQLVLNVENPDSDLYSVVFQIKAASDTWPERTAAHALPNGLSVSYNRGVFGTFAGFMTGTEYLVRAHLVAKADSAVVAASSPEMSVIWDVPDDLRGPYERLWSTVLTVDADGALLGCDNDTGGLDDCSVALVNDSFRFRGTTYRVISLYVDADGDSILELDVSGDGLVGFRAFISFGGNEGIVYPLSLSGASQELSGGPSWADGQRVEIGLDGFQMSPRVNAGDGSLNVYSSSLGDSLASPPSSIVNQSNWALFVSGYDVQYKETSAPNRRATTANDPSTGWVDGSWDCPKYCGLLGIWEVTGLTNGTSYDARGRAKNKVGYGSWVTVTGVPTNTVPAITSVTTGERDSVPTLTVVTRNPDASTYDVAVQIKETGSDWPRRRASHSLPPGVSRRTSASTTNSHVFTGFAKGTEYVVRAHLVVKSDNSHIAASSRQISVTTWDDPDPPTGLGVSVGDTELVLSWTAPSDTGGSGVSLSGYDVQYKTTDATDWTSKSHTGTGTTATITSLVNGTAYQVRVRAKNSVGVSGWVTGSGTPSKPSVSLMAAPNPVVEGSPVIVTATLSRALAGNVTIPVTITRGSAEAGDIGTLTSITISSGSTSATGTITTAHDAGFADETFTVALGTLPTTVAAGAPNSATVTISDDDPGPPTGLGVAAGDAHLSVSWTAPTDTGASGVSLTGYDIQYKTSSTDWTDFTHTGVGTTSTITGLVNGTTYNIQVRAKNASGVSEWVTGSGTPSKPTVTLTAAPNPVTEGSSVTVTVTLSRALAGNVSIPITITRGSAEAGDIGTLTSITINSGSTSNTGTITTAHDVGFADETFTVALGTLPTTVVAGAPNSATVTITDDDPEPPTGLNVNAGDAQLSVSWTAPTDTGAPGASLTGYDVQYKTADATNWSTKTHTGTGTTSTITGLVNGTAYNIQVRAKSSVGVSGWVTGSGTPSKPTVTLTAAPNPVAEGSSVIVTATLSRALASSVVVPVTITRGSAEAGDIGTLTSITINSGSTSATGTITTAHDAGFADETFTVALGTLPSTVAAGTPNSATVTITDDDPGPPTNLGVAAGDAQLSVSWTAPTDKGASGVSLSGYDIQYKTSTAAVWLTKTHTGTATTSTITGLVNGTAYNIRVRARNSSGVSVWVSGSGTPSKPTVTLTAAPNPVAEGSSVTVTVTLSRALAGNVSIPITITRGSAEAGDIGTLMSITISSGSTSATGTITTAHDAGFADETFTVALGTLPATVIAGTPNSATVTITDDDPGPPTGLNVNAGDTQLTVSWTAPTDTGAPGASLTGYDVQYKTSTAAVWLTKTHTGTTTTSTVTGLANGTTYNIQVRAKNSSGVSEWVTGSGTPSQTTVTLTAAPNPVVEGSSVTVTATVSRALSANLVVPITVTRGSSEAGDIGTLTSITINSGSTSATGTITTAHDAGFADETFTVALGSLPSTVAAGTPNSASVTIVDDDPGPPTSLGVAAGDAQLVLSWTAPTDKGASGVSLTGYDIQYKTSSAAVWSTKTHTGTTTSTTITGLVNGTAYDVQVRAKNSSGVSEWVSGSGTPSKPSVTLTAAPNPVAEGSSVTVTATLSRALAGNVSIPVTVTRGSAEAGDIGTLTTITISSGSTSATGTITTAHDAGFADETFTVALGTLPTTVATGTPNSATVTITDDDPGPPTGLGVAAGDAQLALSWTAPTDTGAPSASLSGYDIQYKTSTAAVWLTKTHTGTTTSTTITGLVNGTAYDMQVRAKNSSGVSEWVSGSGTPSKTTVTLTAAPNPVAEGSSVTVTATLSRALSANLAVPVTVTRGSAEAGDIGTLTSITINSGSTSATGRITTAHDAGFADETFTVALGTLPTTVATGTPNSATVTITDDDPGPPTGLGVAAGDAQLALSWTAPTDTGAPSASLSGYDIQYKTSTAAVWLTKTHTGTGTTSTITGLVNGTAYNIQVRAKNASGVSEWVTGSGTPGKPTVTLTAAPNPVAEGSSVTVTATISRTLAGNVSIPITITQGSAEAADIGTLTTITINSGATSGTGTITTNQDTGFADETFTVALGTLPATVAAGAPNSATVTITDDDPGPPTNLGAAAGDTQLVLSWTAPTDTGAPGVSLSGYDVQYKTSSTDWTDFTHTGTTTSTTITGLVNGTTYNIQVRAKNASGVSEWVTGSGTPSKPTVTLAAAPNPVAEGSSVTVTATLSRALASNLSVPITVTRGSAEAADIGTLTSITINSGSTSGTGTITTAQDTDSDDETFTVALGSLPSSVVAGAPSSVLVTVTDDEGVTERGGGPYLPGLVVTPGDGVLGLRWQRPWGPGGVYLVNWKEQQAPDVAATTQDDPSSGWVYPIVVLYGSRYTDYLNRTVYTIKGLRNGVTYDVRVRAIVGGRYGPWSNAQGTPVAPLEPSALMLYGPVDGRGWPAKVMAISPGGSVVLTARLDHPTRRWGTWFWWDTSGDGGGARWGPDCLWQWGTSSLLYKGEQQASRRLCAGTTTPGKTMIVTAGVVEPGIVSEPVLVRVLGPNPPTALTLHAEPVAPVTVGSITRGALRVTARLNNPTIPGMIVRMNIAGIAAAAWGSTCVDWDAPSAGVVHSGLIALAIPPGGQEVTTDLCVGLDVPELTLQGWTDAPYIEAEDLSIVGVSRLALAALKVSVSQPQQSSPKELLQFSPDKHDYEMSVPKTTSTVTVTPTAADFSATVRVNTKAISTDTPSINVPLNIGVNIIKIEVSAKNSPITRTYTITITRTSQDTPDSNSLELQASDPDPPVVGQLEPFNIQVVPGDGTLTVTWNVAPRGGFDTNQIRHALRWSQTPGVWANPGTPYRNDGIIVETGATSYTITGLQNDTPTGVFIRSFTGTNTTEEAPTSSKWIRIKNDTTTPQ